MARSNGIKAETPTEESLDTVDLSSEDTATASDATPDDTTALGTPDIDTCLNSLKTLLSAVEKLQKSRQEVGDIKPLLIKMLDGELLAGEDLEQLKTGISGLVKLVRAYGDHQTALTQAQVARELLDTVLKDSPMMMESRVGNG